MEAQVVKADEIDDTGTDISTISPTNDENFEAKIESRQEQSGTSTPLRPILRRETSTPAPPKQPPPPTPHLEDSVSTDSLSLAQLKRLVSDLPKFEAAAYAYTYEDTRSLPEELEEWFQYTDEDANLLFRGKEAFEDKWYHDVRDTKAWSEATGLERASFLKELLHEIPNQYMVERARNIDALVYVILGVWYENAGLEENQTSNVIQYESFDDRYQRSGAQIRCIRDAVDKLTEIGTIPELFDLLRRICDNEKTSEMVNRGTAQLMDELEKSIGQTGHQDLNNILTILYVVVECGRQQVAEGKDNSIRDAIASLKPNLLQYLCSLIARLRWDDSTDVPLTRLLLLQWKTMLLVFGGSKQLQESKNAICEKGDLKADDETYITASPLDYHLFRQEITSKYPAYSPPQPLVPIELENSSILPPLSNHPSRTVSQDGLQHTANLGINGSGRSVFNQPVHIATPAPSPPPSPAGPGGKGGKKQNYQTNQNFPFLYPPIDHTGSPLDGETIHDTLSGNNWDGTDVPASILEAGQLFASRMRMSRSLRQLWNVREAYIKFERGWDHSKLQDNIHNLDIEGLDLDFDESASSNSGENGAAAVITPEEPNSDVADSDAHQRLDAVEAFYRHSLPYLQSVVIVLLKILLSNVTNLSNQGQNGVQDLLTQVNNKTSEIPTKRPQQNINLVKHLGMVHGSLPQAENNSDRALEELNGTRLREITSKAVAGILLVLLRWFKLSHILKYEYLTQLLLDSNYLPLALKSFAHQDFDRAVGNRNDRDDQGFFYFCETHSRNPSPPPPRPPPVPSSTSSEDEAQPPPIPKSNRSLASSPPPSSPSSSPSPPPPPEVDELGYPTTTIPQEPITTYAPRFFYTTITHLRLLQKITKRKAHRALLLVQYKSSQILRKALKIPQSELRLYTLKLFKSQVPYCGRKWRQGNMRVITAIYLHCKPELRDEWLAGGDVDGVVEEAVPLEQAGRSLVHWWHLREYRDVMEGGGVMEKHDRDKDDFFARELEKMGWDNGGLSEIHDEIDVDDNLGNSVENEWGGGPLSMEGW